MQVCPTLESLLNILVSKDNQNLYTSFLRDKNIAIKCKNVKEVRKILSLSDKSLISDKVAGQLLNYGYVNINCQGKIKSNLDLNVKIIPFKDVIF